MPQAMRQLVLPALLSVSTLGHAHDLSSDALLSATPGWRVGASAALAATQADQRWPTAPWPGVLVLGSAARDQRDRISLEHAVLSAAWVHTSGFGAEFAAGWHDRDQPHWEAARLVLHRQVSRGPAAGQYELSLGRDTVRLGSTIDTAGHFDLHGQAPLVKTAVLNERWIDDGVTLSWAPQPREAQAALQRATLGIWAAKAYPGGPTGKIAPTLHLQGRLGAWTLDGFAAALQPQARGAAVITAAGTGHLHQSPDCRQTLQQLVCFDGRAEVAAASARWQPAGQPWTVQAAYMAKRERGDLYTRNAMVRDQSTIQGGWLALRYQLTAQIQAGVRAERLISSHKLEGAGAGLVAREAGLDTSRPIERLTLVLAWQPRPDLTLTTELGEQRDGQRTRFGAVRMVWHAPRLFGETPHTH